MRRRRQNDFITGAACAIVGMRILSDPALCKLALAFMEVVKVEGKESEDTGNEHKEPDAAYN